MEQGFLHLYYGDGKGKTTAAAGLCLRAVGAGLRCGFAQFLKGAESCERTPLASLGVQVFCPEQSKKFWFAMNEQEKHACCAVAAGTLEAARCAASELDLLVLDEVLDAEALGALPEGALAEFVKARPAGLELVLTGHTKPDEIALLADYVTCFSAEKHPYTKGLSARRGIEY